MIIVQQNSLKENIKELISFTKLKTNWNFYDADPISKSLLLKVLRYILPLKGCQPDISPTARDSIQLEWDIYITEDKSYYLEVEINKNRISICHRYNDGNFSRSNPTIDPNFDFIMRFKSKEFSPKDLNIMVNKFKDSNGKTITIKNNNFSLNWRKNKL